MGIMDSSYDRREFLYNAGQAAVALLFGGIVLHSCMHPKLSYGIITRKLGKQVNIRSEMTSEIHAYRFHYVDKVHTYVLEYAAPAEEGIRTQEVFTTKEVYDSKDVNPALQGLSASALEVELNKLWEARQNIDQKHIFDGKKTDDYQFKIYPTDRR